MSTGDWGAPRAAFDSSNDLVPLLLGLAKLLDDVARCAVVPAPPDRAPSVGDARDPLVAALLGLLSVRRTVRGWLAVAAAEGLPARAASADRAVADDVPASDYLR